MLERAALAVAIVAALLGCSGPDEALVNDRAGRSEPGGAEETPAIGEGTGGDETDMPQRAPTTAAEAAFASYIQSQHDRFLQGLEAEVLITFVELEFVHRPVTLRTNAAVFADGRVRWGYLQSRGGGGVSLATIAPAIDGLARDATERVFTGRCLPMLRESDLPAGAASLATESRIDASEALCASVAASGVPAPEAWRVDLDDIGMLVRVDGELIFLHTWWRAHEGSLEFNDEPPTERALDR